MSDHGAQLRWKGQLGANPKPTLSTFPVGGNRSTRERPETFGRYKSVVRNGPTISEVKVGHREVPGHQSPSQKNNLNKRG
jgi:hypothetical protein